MRLRRLEVENFKCIRSANVDFGPGMNVLQGPNELGKSTIAEAVRAALLMPKSVRAEEDYRPWSGAGPTRVALTFEDGDDVWRVRKKFDHPYNAVLEQQSAGASGKFYKVAEGRLVDDRLRELLGWGLAKLGGRGAPTKPVSYLVVALLGQQGKVEEILGASLDSDSEKTGTVSITKALGALGSDPRVTVIVGRLSDRVEAVFTPTERLKQGIESPVAKLHEKWRAEERGLTVLRADDVTSKAIGSTVVSLQDEWLRFSAEQQDAAAVLEATQLRHDRDKTRQQLQGQIDECRAKLEQAKQLTVRLGALRGVLDAAVETERAERATLVAAGLEVEGLSSQVQQALQHVVRAQASRDQATLEDESSRQQRRAVLVDQKATAESRLRQVEATVAGAARSAALESDLVDAVKSVEEAKAALERAVSVRDYATWSADLSAFVELETGARQLQAASEEVRRREVDTSADLNRVEEALAAAESHRQGQGWKSDPAHRALTVEIERLEAAELHLRIDALRSRIATLEGHDEQRSRGLDTASQKREEASRLEQQVAASALPPAEQVSAWREWEAELGAEAPARREGLATGAMATLVAAGVGVIVGATVFLTNAGSTATAVAALVAALLAGALAWQRASTRERVAETGVERRKLLQERLAREVRPAMRRANVPSLAEFEGARSALDEMKSRAGRLRVEAEQDDQAAARLAAQVAPLEGLRHELAELMKGDRRVNPDDLRQLLEECGSDAVKVRARQNDRQAQLNALQATLRLAGDAAVVAAQELREQKRTLHVQMMNGAAAAKAQHDEALRQCDPARAEQLRALLEASSVATQVPMAEEAAAGELERAREAAHEATAKAAELQRQIEAMRTVVDQDVASLGDSPTNAHSKAQAELDEIGAQLAAVTQRPNDVGAHAAEALDAAVRRRDGLNRQLGEAKANSERATARALATAEALANVSKQVASAEGALSAIDRVGLEARLENAIQNPVFAEPEDSGPDVATASEGHELATGRLRECEARLNEAKGRLHLAGGHAVAERLALQEEIVEFARQEYEEKELTERAALRLLKDIKAAEAEATSNLGRTLGGPVTEMLKELTGGRYGAVEFTTDLTASGVAAAESSRDLEHLSVGTREQLATLVRLAIAAQLQTTLLLDDQLVHSDTERLHWFRDRLCASARDRQHQIVVIACRPGDYLPPDGAESSCPVNVVDLTAVVDVFGLKERP